jgi:hypothetical protein
MQPPLWQLSEAVEVLREVESIITPYGFHCGLTGSVLYKGESNKDLDIILYPHANSYTDSDLERVLVALGYKLGGEEPSTITKVRTVKGHKIRDKKVDLFIFS